MHFITLLAWSCIKSWTQVCSKIENIYIGVYFHLISAKEFRASKQIIAILLVLQQIIILYLLFSPSKNDIRLLHIKQHLFGILYLMHYKYILIPAHMNENQKYIFYLIIRIDKFIRIDKIIWQLSSKLESRWNSSLHLSWFYSLLKFYIG